MTWYCQMPQAWTLVTECLVHVFHKSLAYMLHDLVVLLLISLWLSHSVAFTSPADPDNESAILSTSPGNH